MPVVGFSKVSSEVKHKSIKDFAWFFRGIPVFVLTKNSPIDK